MAITPPTCKTCKKAEYKHVCSGHATTLGSPRTTKPSPRAVPKPTRPNAKRNKK